MFTRTRRSLADRFSRFIKRSEQLADSASYKDKQEAYGLLNNMAFYAIMTLGLATVSLGTYLGRNSVGNFTYSTIEKIENAHFRATTREQAKNLTPISIDTFVDATSEVLTTQDINRQSSVCLTKYEVSSENPRSASHHFVQAAQEVNFYVNDVTAAKLYDENPRIISERVTAFNNGTLHQRMGGVIDELTFVLAKESVFNQYVDFFVRNPDLHTPSTEEALERMHALLYHDCAVIHGDDLQEGHQGIIQGTFFYHENVLSDSTGFRPLKKHLDPWRYLRFSDAFGELQTQIRDSVIATLQPDRFLPKAHSQERVLSLARNIPVASFPQQRALADSLQTITDLYLQQFTWPQCKVQFGEYAQQLQTDLTTMQQYTGDVTTHPLFESQPYLLLHQIESVLTSYKTQRERLQHVGTALKSQESIVHWNNFTRRAPDVAETLSLTGEIYGVMLQAMEDDCLFASKVYPPNSMQSEGWALHQTIDGKKGPALWAREDSVFYVPEAGRRISYPVVQNHVASILDGFSGGLR